MRLPAPPVDFAESRKNKNDLPTSASRSIAANYRRRDLFQNVRRAVGCHTPASCLSDASRIRGIAPTNCLFLFPSRRITTPVFSGYLTRPRCLHLRIGGLGLYFRTLLLGRSRDCGRPATQDYGQPFSPFRLLDGCAAGSARLRTLIFAIIRPA